MTLGLLNLVMLFGLIAVAIPVIIHLLNRQRYQVVDWGAMQFLQVSQVRRRKLFFEEFLLMLLRMGMIALLVLALTAPYASGPLVAQFASRPSRDVVLIFDGSASMGLNDGKNVTPHEAARAWAGRFLQELSPGDTVAVVLARQQPVPVVEKLTHDLARVGEEIARLPQPRGGGDGPRAVAWARDLLRMQGQHDEQDIIILTDGQRSGWFDAGSLAQWKKLGQELGPDGTTSAENQPRLWLVNVHDQGSAGQFFPNYYLTPLQSAYSQVWRYQPVRFNTTLMMKGPLPLAAPYRLKLFIDGNPVRDLPVPEDYPWSSGQVPISFSHQFTSPGSHLVSVVVEPDPPADQRSADYVPKDFLQADNRSDLAVLVRERLQVLLVEGADDITAESSTSALRKTFNTTADAGHPSAVAADTVTVKDFNLALLQDRKPRVLVLADVPHLGPPQRQAIEQYLADGGSVLAVVGERISDPSHYNHELFRDGQGWLPARLEKVAGSRYQAEQAAAIEMGELRPPLAIFRAKAKTTLGQARFPLWWKVNSAGKTDAAVLATLNNGDPLLVEKAYRKGRVLLCTVPLDHAWGSTLPGIWEYPVLVHELIYHLANTRAIEFNVAPGQPLRFEPQEILGEAKLPDLPLSVVVHGPQGKKETVRVESWPLFYSKTDEPGPYQLQLPNGKPVYYVVETDRQESELALASEEEREAIQKEVSVHFENDPYQIGLAVIGTEHREDIWWCLMLGVVGLLCLEIWMTRRMVARREGLPS